VTLAGVGMGWFFYSRTRGGIYRKAERLRAERVKAELEELERRLREKIGKTRYEVLGDLSREIMRGKLMEGAGETLPALPMEEEIKKLERLRRRLD